MKSRAVTLVELMVTLAILMILVVLPAPTMKHAQANSRQSLVYASLAGSLVQARSLAASSGDTIAVVFDPQSDRPYALYRNKEARPVALAPNLAELGWALQLPQSQLNHPTTGAPILTALTTSSQGRLTFTPEGSDSGTIILSDGANRAICAVIAGATGRVRIYVWQSKSGWRSSG